MARKDISDEMIIRGILAWNEEYKKPFNMFRPPFDEYLERITGQPNKVCFAALYRANSRGVIDYGTSIRFPFLAQGAKIQKEEMK